MSSLKMHLSELRKSNDRYDKFFKWLVANYSNSNRKEITIKQIHEGMKIAYTDVTYITKRLAEIGLFEYKKGRNAKYSTSASRIIWNKFSLKEVVKALSDTRVEKVPFPKKQPVKPTNPPAQVAEPAIEVVTEAIAPIAQPVEVIAEPEVIMPEPEISTNNHDTIHYTFPLRINENISFSLPANITKQEMKRLSHFIKNCLPLHE
jgi:hypothetical protein